MKRQKALKSLGQTAIKGAKFVKKHKLVSRGLKAAAPLATAFGQPELTAGLTVAGQAASQLGLGFDELPSKRECKKAGFGGKKRVSKGPRKPSAWIAHVKKYRAAHPSLSYKQALKQASASYKKGQSGGAVRLPGAQVRRRQKCKPCPQLGRGVTLPGSQGGGSIRPR